MQVDIPCNGQLLQIEIPRHLNCLCLDPSRTVAAATGSGKNGEINLEKC